MNSGPNFSLAINGLTPLKFITVGMVALLTACGLVLAFPQILTTYHYNAHVIATTHLIVLGWILSVAMGSMYQLIPVALETKLHKESLARKQFWIHTIGFIGMVAMFWIWDMKQLGHFGSLFGLGVILFAYNLGRTLWRIPKWNVVAFGIASAVSWLVLTMSAGLYLACSKCWDFSPFEPIAAMHAHAHLGILGIFVMLIVGVSYKLVPMFLITEIRNQSRAYASIIFLNVGVLTAVTAILVAPTLKPLAALLILAGIGCYLMELRAMVSSRRRRPIEFSIKIFFSGIAFFVPLTAMGLVLSWPTLPLTQFTGQLENLYGFWGLFGLVTFALCGMLYKIVPFLVWYRVYAPKIGKVKVPALHELYSHTQQKVGFFLALGGVLMSAAAILLGHDSCLRVAFSLMLIGHFVTFANIARVFSHLWRNSSERRAASASTTLVTTGAPSHA
jgi:cbb3-type cytochrome oxidase subunit 1